MYCHVPSGVEAEVGGGYTAMVGGNLEHGRIRRFEMAVLDPEEVDARLVRRSTVQDLAWVAAWDGQNLSARRACLARVRSLGLEMHVVRVRFNLDRTHVEVMFTAEGRVDFRELVRELARDVRARVLMKQVGVRDAAATTGGIGSCGRPLCCSVWKTRFEAINIRHVKVQNLSMNPSAITGMCGRLKCCLRFELDGDGQPVNGCKGNGCAKEKGLNCAGGNCAAHVSSPVPAGADVPSVTNGSEARDDHEA